MSISDPASRKSESVPVSPEDIAYLGMLNGMAVAQNARNVGEDVAAVCVYGSSSGKEVKPEEQKKRRKVASRIMTMLLKLA